MHERVEEFVATARERYGFAPAVEEFPEEGTPTAARAAEAVDCSVSQIVNSLVFAVDGELVLAMTSGGNRVDEAALAAHFDADEVGMADPEAVRETVGWAIGGVPPLCHDRAIPAVLDPALLDHERVWAAAGTPHSVFPIDPERLRDLADADVVDVTEDD